MARHESAAAMTAGGAVRVDMDTTQGRIVIEVYPDRAPLSAAQFLHCVRLGVYEGGSFWRAVRVDNDHGTPGIEVVQASAVSGAAPLDGLAHEPTSVTGLRHLDGTVSLGRAEPGSATAAAFFICVGDQPALDEGGLRNPDRLGFAALGRVIRGMEVVRAIHQGATRPDAPVDYIRGQVLAVPVRIEKAVMEVDA